MRGRITYVVGRPRRANGPQLARWTNEQGWRWISLISAFALVSQVEDDAQAYANIQGFRRGMEKIITTSGIPICKLPKHRLGEALEFLEEVLDSTLTAAATYII